MYCNSYCRSAVASVRRSCVYRNIYLLNAQFQQWSCKNTSLAGKLLNKSGLVGVEVPSFHFKHDPRILQVFFSKFVKCQKTRRLTDWRSHAGVWSVAMMVFFAACKFPDKCVPAYRNAAWRRLRAAVRLLWEFKVGASQPTCTLWRHWWILLSAPCS